MMAGNSKENVSNIFKVNLAKHKLKSYCVCCLHKNVTLVRLSTCKHTGFLEYFTKLKMHSENGICLICHNFLKTIDVFMQMVENSDKILSERSKKIQSQNLTSKLQLSKTQIVYAVDSQELVLDIKSEPQYAISDNLDFVTDDHDILETVDDMKLEHIESDTENDIPLADIRIFRELDRKKRKTRGNLLKKGDGKIKIVDMTADELNAEREQDANSEKYIKLPYKCDYCLVSFEFEMSYKHHMEKHALTPGGIVCRICRSVLNSKLSYKVHMQRHIRRYECMVCGVRHRSLKSALCHYSSAHELVNEEYSCELCGFVTDSYRRHRYHKEKHRKKPECEICGNVFANVSGLRIHMYTIHSGKQVFKCPDCPKQYSSRSGLAAHATAHVTAPDAYCRDCNFQFRSKYYYRRHLKTHSNHVTDKDKRYVCDECGHKFTTKTSLEAHIKFKHLNISSHVCDKCSKVFRRPCHLKDHKDYVHQKKPRPRNKVCDYCGRAFHSLTILRSHIRRHTGERPLQCTRCTATFAHSAALYNHTKLIHSPKVQH